jgi:hypothetical protein
MKFLRVNSHRRIHSLGALRQRLFFFDVSGFKASFGRT